MKSRPILFSAPMVRAILAGTKTQTRRVVREDAGNRGKLVGDHVRYWRRGEEDPRRWCGCDGLGSIGWVLCPYGEPGDRLWVKEAIRFEQAWEDGYESSVFVADGARTKADAWPWKLKTLPGMFMSRGLSRITLEVVGVRVERLQDISEEDARAEGVDQLVLPGFVLTPREAFCRLWDSINGPGAWDAKPWVWRIEFKMSGQ